MKEERKRYNDFSGFLKRYFPGKIQKISVDAGFTCPNRDGTKGYGGCTYCNNRTFSPVYCEREKSVRQQIEDGMAFFARKYPSMEYLAYFQAYTNTYADPSQLISLYEEALSVPGIRGIIIGTRPDCMPDSLLDKLEELSHNRFVLVEYGIESTDDRTLERINRGHTFEESADAVTRTAARNLSVGGHLILGLPGETDENILRHADILSTLPLNTLKLHQLQLIRHTSMAIAYEREPEKFRLFTVDEYIGLVIRFLERLRPDIIVERFASQSPKELLIAPDWGLKNYEFANRLLSRMKELDTWQGRLYEGSCFD